MNEEICRFRASYPDGTAETIDWTEGNNPAGIATGAYRYAIYPDGNTLGSPETDGDTPRTITLKHWVRGDNVDAMLRNVRAVLRMLDRAATFASTAPGRFVTFEYKPKNAAITTIYDILDGKTSEAPDPFDYQIINDDGQNWWPTASLTLQTAAPYGRSAEQTLLTATTLSPLPTITHACLATGANVGDGTIVGNNMAPKVAGSLWSKTRTADAGGETAQAVALNNARYFGHTTIQFACLYWGILTAKVGTMQGVWEYYNGAWTALPTTSTMRSGGEATEFDTVCDRGKISFTPPADWIKKSITINAIAVNAYWIRYRLTSVAGATAPVMTNGPVMSNAGLGYIDNLNTVVNGDVGSNAMLHLTNPGATALGGVVGCAVSGLLTGAPPQFQLSFLTDTIFTPSGNTTGLVEADSTAPWGERYKVTFNATFVDGGIYFDSSQTSNIYCASANIDAKWSLSGDMALELAFKVTTGHLSDGSIYILGQRWLSSSDHRCWLLGIYNNRLYGMLSKDGATIARMAGTTELSDDTWYIARLEFSSGGQRGYLMLDGDLQQSAKTKSASIHAASADVEFGRGSQLDVSDIDSGKSLGLFDGIISFIKVETTIQGGSYSLPTAEPTDTGSAVKLLLIMNAAATSAVVDTALTAGAAETSLNFRHTAANATPTLKGGYFNASDGGGTDKVIGIRIPKELSEAWRGSFRAYLLVKTASAMTGQGDLSFALQVGPGDPDLPMTTPASVPFFNADTNAPSGYILLDLGSLSLPNGDLYEGFEGSETASQFSTLYLFASYTFDVSTSCYLGGLVLMPSGRGGMFEYETFRLGTPDASYDASYAIAQNEGLLVDGRVERLVMGQTTTTGYTEQKPNVYKRPSPSRPSLLPGKQAWIFAEPLRAANPGAGVEGDAYVFVNNADTLTLRCHSVPQWVFLGSPIT